jgi:hypothetical protein
MIEVLPDSRAKSGRGSVMIDTPYGRLWHVPLFCGNCGDAGPLVTENCTFAFWLCPKCETKWSPLVGMLAVPDEIFFARLKQEQIEQCGREMTLPELVTAISDESNILSKLAREAPGRN